MPRGNNLCFWLGAFVLESGVFCQTYNAIDVITPAPTLETHPTSINKQGDIAGFYADALSGNYHGFVRAHEGCIPVGPACIPFTSFDARPGILNGGTFATSINDAGAITGYFIANVPPPARKHGFVRDPGGSLTSFDPPGSISTIALSINTGGAITGYYNESNLLLHGFVREPNGTITSFDPPGSTLTNAVGINANGTITGSYVDANNRYHGFVRRPGGTIVSFDPPKSTGTMVTSINTAGAITGVYTVASGRTFGFVRQPRGTFERFDVPGTLIGAFINDEGAIAGSYSDNSGSHGYVRSPQGMITSFDAPGCFYLGGNHPPTTGVASINQGGVIIGSCRTGGVINFVAGYERFPAMPGF